MLCSSALLALVLSAPSAEAGGGRARHIGLLPFVTDKAKRVSIVLPPGEASSVAAEVTSGAGDETVVLTESDVWLHGAAAIDALPGEAASVTLTLYDTASAELVSFRGKLGTDGALALAPVSTCGIPGACDSEALYDIEVRAAEAFANADGGFDLGFDFNGADATEIAYADLQFDKLASAEVYFDDAGSVWEGELTIAPEGLVEIETTALDARGRKIDSASLALGAAWYDGGEGVNTVASDDDPLTTVAVHALGGSAAEAFGGPYALTVVSTDWTAATAPTTAEIELEDGETLTVPANSYQVTTSASISFVGAPESDAFQVTIDGVRVADGSAFADRGLCANGTCLRLGQADDGSWVLSATAYAADAGDLPSSVEVALTSTRKLSAPKQSSTTLSFDDDVSVVFSSAFSLSGDPAGVDVVADVGLLGAADRKGKRKTVSTGTFYGTFCRDRDGELSIGGADKDGVQAKGDILIGAEPIDFELVDGNDDGVIQAPPAVQYRNGTGTRATATNTSQTQQAQLL